MFTFALRKDLVSEFLDKFFLEFFAMFTLRFKLYFTFIYLTHEQCECVFSDNK